MSGLSSCSICLRSCKSSRGGDSSPSPTSLEEELAHYWILSALLGVRREALNALLAKYGSPSGWLERRCAVCDKLVRDLVQLHVKMGRLVERIRAPFSSTDKGKDNSLPPAAKEVRDFVRLPAEIKKPELSSTTGSVLEERPDFGPDVSGFIQFLEGLSLNEFRALDGSSLEKGMKGKEGYWCCWCPRRKERKRLGKSWKRRAEWAKHMEEDHSGCWKHIVETLEGEEHVCVPGSCFPKGVEFRKDGEELRIKEEVEEEDEDEVEIENEKLFECEGFSDGNEDLDLEETFEITPDPDLDLSLDNTIAKQDTTPNKRQRRTRQQTSLGNQDYDLDDAVHDDSDKTATEEAGGRMTDRIASPASADADPDWSPEKSDDDDRNKSSKQKKTPPRKSSSSRPRQKRMKPEGVENEESGTPIKRSRTRTKRKKTTVPGAESKATDSEGDLNTMDPDPRPDQDQQDPSFTRKKSKKRPSGSRKFHCALCSLTFASQVDYRNHRKEKHAIGFHCNLRHAQQDTNIDKDSKDCKQAFSSAESLEYHVRRYHEDHAHFRCKGCGFLNPHWEAFRDHLRKKDVNEACVNSSLKCPKCWRMLESERALEIHDEAKHLYTIRNGTPFKCTFEGCELEFQWLAPFTIHVRSHTEDVSAICEICGARVSSQARLKDHRDTVHGEAKYECKVCKKKFRNKSLMRRHEKLHGEECPFLCSICGKGFKLKEYLRLHYWSHDPDKHNKYSLYQYDRKRKPLGKKVSRERVKPVLEYRNSLEEEEGVAVGVEGDVAEADQ